MQMKLIKTLAAGSLALGFAGSALAVTDVYVCGSTAFRSAVVTAEIDVLGGAANVATAESDTKAVTATTISDVSGTDAGNNAIVFHNHWTGSVAGVTDITNSNPLSYIDDSLLGGAGSNVQNAAASDNVIPQVAMSDNVYTDTVTVLSGSNTTGKNFAKNIGGLTDGGTLGEPAVAVVTFQWELGANVVAPSTSSLNITQDVASYLLSNGSIPLSVVDGNQADSGNFLLYVGRNEDSGTRVLYQGESWGAGLSPKVIGSGTVQWMAEQSTTPGGAATATGYPTSSTGAGYPSISATGGITAIKKWPGSWTLNTETAVTWGILAGHSGYNGGGDVAAILSSPNPNLGLTFTNAADANSLGATYNSATSNIYLVTLIGTHDAASITGGTLLTYNGVGISDNNIETGEYALWNYEHLYYLSTLSGIPQTAANELADELYNFTEAQYGGSPAAGSPGIPLGSMLITRGQAAGAQIK
jgi:hypothetical protein